MQQMPGTNVFQDQHLRYLLILGRRTVVQVRERQEEAEDRGEVVRAGRELFTVLSRLQAPPDIHGRESFFVEEGLPFDPHSTAGNPTGHT